VCTILVTKTDCAASLLYRRLRGDVIETYKYLHGIYNTNSSQFLPLSIGDSGVSTRGHSLKLQKRDCKSVLRANVLDCESVELSTTA